jgi:hypothetical protein
MMGPPCLPLSKVHNREKNRESKSDPGDLSVFPPANHSARLFSGHGVTKPLTRFLLGRGLPDGLGSAGKGPKKGVLRCSPKGIETVP